MASGGPGKAYRRGITLPDLFKMFPDDETAEQWFIDLRWPDGVACPYCGSIDVLEGAKHKSMPFRCRDCKKRFSTRVGTVMEGSKLGFQVWVIAIYLMTTNLKGVSSMKFHRDLGVTQKTAWFLAHRLREAAEDSGGIFAGPVEVDETFIGGLERNKHASKKLHVGGGSGGKTPVAGIRDRYSGLVYAEVVPQPTSKVMHAFVLDRIAQGAMVYTDDATYYSGLPRHQAVKHSVGQYVDHMAHTNGIESFWAMLKRGFHGTYHQMSPKHLDRYVQEFSGRHNDRPLNTIDQMNRFARRMVGARLRYQDLIS